MFHNNFDNKKIIRVGFGVMSFEKFGTSLIRWPFLFVCACNDMCESRRYVESSWSAIGIFFFFSFASLFYNSISHMKTSVSVLWKIKCTFRIDLGRCNDGYR